MRRNFVAMLAAVLSMGIGSSAWAVSVGINFISDRQDASLASGEPAGAGPFAQMNWNNTAPIPSPGPQRPVSGTTADIAGPMSGVLVDDTGAATGISVSWAGENSWNTNNGTSNGHNKLMNGYLDNAGGNPQSVVTFNDIPFEYYDVVAYFGSDGNNRTGTVTDGSITYSFSTFSNQGGNFPAAYQQTTDTGGGNPQANFAHFQANNTEDLTVTLNRGNNNSGFHGVQIIERTSGPVLAGRIGNVGGKVGGAAFELNLDTDTATGANVPWRIEGNSVNPTPGLKAELFTGVNLNNEGAWNNFLAGNPAPDAIAKAPNINFANNNGGPGGAGYYPEWEAAGFTPGSNQNNYSARLTGEIFIPQPGTYRFKDGNDDYTFLSIDGDELTDDNGWTGTNGTHTTGGQTFGSPIVSKTFDEAGWFEIDFRMGEGGGGDSGVLYWDAGDPNNPLFPSADNQPADPSLLIPENFFRSTFLAELSGTGQVGDLMSDGIFRNANGDALDVTGGTVYTLTVGPFNGLSEFQTSFEVVPEPATGLLALLGVAAIGGRRRRRAA